MPADNAAPAAWPGWDRGPVEAGQVSVVLPTYDEAGNIGPLMEGILAALGPGVEIIVVDDDSPDGTSQVVRDFMAGHPQVRLVCRASERGLTSAIWRGIQESQRAVVAWMDCDLSMPPADLPRLLAALPGRDMTLGSRYIPGGRDAAHSPLALALSMIICRLARAVLGGQVMDFTSGFVMARRPLLIQLGLNGDYGEYCIDLVHRAQLAGYRLLEVPYVCVPRHSGLSKTSVGLGGFLKRGPGYLAAVWRLRGLGRAKKVPGGRPL